MALQMLVPHLMIPLVPLIADSVPEPPEFAYLQTFPWVLTPIRYKKASGITQNRP